MLASCGLLVILLLARWPSTMAAAALLLVGVAAADLWLYGFRFHPFQRPRAMYPVLDEVRHLTSVPGARPRFAQMDGWQLPFNASMVYGLYGINGYDVFIPVRFADLVALADADERTYALSNFVWPLQGTGTQPPVLDLLGVRSDTAPLPATGPGTRAFSGTFAVFDQTGALPPAFLATCWQTASDAAALGRLKTMSASQLRSTAIVSDGQRGGAGPGASGADCQAGPAGVIRTYESERVVVDTPDTRPGVLVLTDQWYPGWTVRVDGHPAQMLVVDHALRGVALAAGPHRVEFRYRPRWPLLGLAVTILAVDLALLLIASGRPRRGRT